MEEHETDAISCVKCSLKSLCLNDVVHDTIVNDILPKVNTISFLSYKLLNYHFTRLLEEKKPLPHIKSNLFYKACCTVSRLTLRKRRVDPTNELHISWSHLKDYIKTDVPARDYIWPYITALNRNQLTACDTSQE